MRIAIIGCAVFNREISHLVAESRHAVRVWWIAPGPARHTGHPAHRAAARAIDEVERENERLPEGLRFEAVILAYGLCSNGVIGLRSRSLPVVVPRCDDCISLFLGSADRYRELFRKLPAFTGTTPAGSSSRSPRRERTTSAAARNMPRSSARKTRIS